MAKTPGETIATDPKPRKPRKPRASSKAQPRIVKSPEGRWFIVLKFKEKTGVDPQTLQPASYLVAVEKFDVTEQMQAILGPPFDPAPSEYHRPPANYKELERDPAQNNPVGRLSLDSPSPDYPADL